jgi:DNA replication licensing factor MCM6
MFVRRVNEDQEETQDGVEEEELLVWYLEQKENEMETQEDLEAERLLAKKVLKKVVKVRFLEANVSVRQLLTCTTGAIPDVDPG